MPPMQCGYAFSRADSLRGNLRIHSGAKSKKCDQCDYASYQKSGLNLHLRTHISGEKSIKCNLCDYATFYASSLKIHFKIHTGESFKCTQCDYVNNYMSSLMTH